MNPEQSVYEDIAELRRRLTALETTPRVPGLTTTGAGGFASSTGAASPVGVPVGGLTNVSGTLPSVTARAGASGRLLLMFGGIAILRTSPTATTQVLDIGVALSGANTVAAAGQTLCNISYQVSDSQLVVPFARIAYLTSLAAGDNLVQMLAGRQGLTGSPAAINVGSLYIHAIPL